MIKQQPSYQFSFSVEHNILRAGCLSISTTPGVVIFQHFLVPGFFCTLLLLSALSRTTLFSQLLICLLYRSMGTFLGLRLWLLVVLMGELRLEVVLIGELRLSVVVIGKLRQELVTPRHIFPARNLHPFAKREIQQCHA